MDRNPAHEGQVQHQIQIQIPPSLVRIYVWARTYWFEIFLAVVVTITVLALIAGGVIHFRAGKEKSWCNPNFVVAKDGTGDYKSIGAAVKDSPDHSPVRFCILIRKGLYHENIIIGRNKSNLVLMGEGMQKTVIISNRSNSAYSLTQSATLWVIGKGFQGRNFAVINAAGPDEKNAVALENLADRSIFYKCRFVGYQATLNAQRGMQFYHSCEIQGTKYYVFGDASAYFQNCQIKTTQLFPTQLLVVAGQARTNPLLNTGFVFHQCDFLTTQLLPEGEESESAEAQTYLAGSIAAYSRTVVLLSSMDASIGGWLVRKSARNTAYFQEFNNQRPSSSSYNGTSINSSEAAQFSLRVFLEGDRWIPTYVPYTLDLF